ncbi:hypothetical protein [Lysinibacillus xylanilyticus]|uniref:hypothetical protein n=1 Tax=Lysinibacillus xylanilyticus TaxID=582475 RepID=UPI00380E48DD
MIANLIFRENFGWIDFSVVVEEEKYFTNSSNVKVGEILNFLQSQSFHNITFNIFANVNLNDSRSYKIYKYIVTKMTDIKELMNIELKYEKILNSNRDIVFLQKGIMSAYSGIYPDVIGSVVKHIYIDNYTEKVANNLTKYISNSGVNSALIISVSSIKEAQMIGEKIKDKIHHFFLHFMIAEENVFLLDYPYLDEYRVKKSDIVYEDVKTKVLNCDKVSYQEMLECSYIENFFDKLGGESVNRIRLLEHGFVNNMEKKFIHYDFSKIFYNGIDKVDLIIFDLNYYMKAISSVEGRVKISTHNLFYIDTEEEIVMINLFKNELKKYKKKERS